MDACQSGVNDGTTEQLVPVQITCCYCIPLEPGLILLALTKLVLSWFLLIILIVILLVSNLFAHPTLLYTIIVWIAICIDVVDVLIAVAVFISVCLKNRRIMKMYYIYSIFVLGSLTFLYCVIVYIITGDFFDILKLLIIFLLIFIMQEYLNHLVKIELRKLESSEQFQL